MEDYKSNSLGTGTPDCPTDLGMNNLDPKGVTSVPSIDIPPDPELASEGWERRFMADPLRAEEAQGIYSELGYEVRVVAVKPMELSALCGDCRLVACSSYVTLYTRRAPP